MTDFAQESKQRRNKNLIRSGGENFHDVEVIPTTSDASTSSLPAQAGEVQKLEISEADRCKRLQKLSCISLSSQEEQKLGAQLSDIIAFLGQLPEPKLNIENGKLKTTEAKLTLRTMTSMPQNSDSTKILKNVQHPIVNNSIVIKSVLN